MKRDSFIFYASFYEAIQELDDDMRLQAYDAVIAYALTGAEPTASGIVSALFKLMKPQIDANQKRYENGKKGGRAKMSLKRRKNMSNKTRFEVFERDSFTCQYCGKSAPDAMLEVDHIYPVALGQDDRLKNLTTSCHECNMGKGVKVLKDGGI